MLFISKNKNSLFLGQSVNVPGNLLYTSLKKVNASKKIELPIFEDTQMGMAIGMSLNGFIPITCFPRFDFLILAMNQLVNHLDKMRTLSNNSFKPRVIIRTSIGSKKPLNGGVQHTQDYTNVFKNILTEINVVSLKNSKDIFNEFKLALNRKDSKSTLLIENGDYYNSR